ncbi:MAG: TonB-dependent receptor [Candidatus Aminicenantales bacterium]
MNNTVLKAILLLSLTLILTSTSFAQRQTGSIFGRIIDKEENALPGAIITVSGPALMGIRNYITGDTGTFRFSSLLPGEYQMRTEMPGFKTLVRKGILVSVGKTTEVTIELEITEIEEEVTVISTPPPIDIQSTKISVNYSSQFLTSIPMNRDLYDIQNSIPGAISEGVALNRSSSILGGTVQGQLYALDGAPMNDPATFYSMTNINIDVFDEIEFEFGAHPAEVGQTGSTYINIISKSGGDKLTGGAVFYYQGGSLNQDLWTPEQLEALNINPPEKYTDSKDFSLNIGGPILEEKAWIFLSGRRLAWNQAYAETPEKRMASIGFTESPHYDLEHREWLGFVKMTFQLTRNIRYSGMLHYNNIYEPVYANSIGADTAFEATQSWGHENTFTTTHQMNWILSQNTNLDIRGTYIHSSFPTYSRYNGQYTFYDRQADIMWGTSPFNEINIRKKIVGSASIVHFMNDFLGGSHEFKAGAEFEQSEYHRDWYSPNPYYSYWYDYAAGDPYYYSPSQKQGRLRILTCPPEEGQWDVQDHVRRFSAYLQDSIVKGKLALNLGLRFDYSFLYEPVQIRPELRFQYGPENLAEGMDPNELLIALGKQLKAAGLGSPFDALTTPWKKIVEFATFSPRVGLVYDLFGDGKTAFNLSFSRYFEPIWTAQYSQDQIFGPNSFNWYWNDLNGNKKMDLPPTDSYLLQSYSEQDPYSSFYMENLKAPYTNEVIAGIEHELIKDFKLGIQFVWKQNKNIIDDIDIVNGYDSNATDEKGLIWLPFAFTDPGMDGIFHTEDDQTLTVYGLRADRPAPIWKGTNLPEAKRKYWAVMFTFDKRMSNKWQLSGSILYSSLKGNTEGFEKDAENGAAEGMSGISNDPNSLINAYGPLRFDRPLQIKVMGTYILPWDFILSAYVQHMSGSPWGRTLDRIYFPANYMGLGTYYSYTPVRAENPGARRHHSYTNLDMRIEKNFTVGQNGKLTIYVDVFNVGGQKELDVNDNPGGSLYYNTYADATQAAYLLGSNYKKIIGCYGVRSIRLGIRYSF